MRITSKAKAVLGVMLACIVCTTACKGQDFDASGYVKSSLDAVFHQEYKAYSEFRNLSEDEAKAEVEEDFDKTIEQEFGEFADATEGGIDTYSQIMRKVNQLAKYEVGEAKKTDDGNYTVTVTVEPSDVYQTLQANTEEVTNQKISDGQNPLDPDVFASILVESIQKSIDNNTYGEAQEVEVSVIKDDSNVYNLDESEVDKLGNLMFPD